MTIPQPTDWLSKLVEIAQVLLVPLLTWVVVLARELVKRVREVYPVVFGRPEIKEDNGLIGVARRVDRTLERFDRDLDKLCDANGIQRAEVRDDG